MAGKPPLGRAEKAGATEVDEEPNRERMSDVDFGPLLNGGDTCKEEEWEGASHKKKPTNGFNISK